MTNTNDRYDITIITEKLQGYFHRGDRVWWFLIDGKWVSHRKREANRYLMDAFPDTRKWEREGALEYYNTYKGIYHMQEIPGFSDGEVNRTAGLIGIFESLAYWMRMSRTEIPITELAKQLKEISEDLSKCGTWEEFDNGNK